MNGGRPHGRAKYCAEKCRCTTCRDGNAAYTRRRRRAEAYGRPTTDLADAAPVRAHIHDLQAAGMSIRNIAAAAGVGPATIAQVLGIHGGTPARRLRPKTAEAIVAVRADDNPRLDATPVRRLLHGMVAAGYTKAWIADALGGEVRALRPVATVSRADAEAVAALAERCALTPGPSRHARVYAAARGWKVDWLWEDLAGGEDGGRFVDPVAVERACTGEPVTLTRAERAAAFARLWAGGHTETYIARRLRLSGTTATRMAAGLQSVTAGNVTTMGEHR